MKYLLLLIALLISCTPKQIQTVHWQNYYAVGPEYSIAQNKHVIIYVGDESCEPCKLQNKVFQDPEVIEELNKDYISIKMNYQEVSGITTVPTIIFLMPNGREIFRAEQFVKKEKLLGGLKEIAKHFE